jgi:hypothetical protein
LTGQQFSDFRRATIRLLVIPLAIYSAWLLEIFLLNGSLHLFWYPNPSGILLYTIIACIITGIIAPFLCMKTAFISGAVTMFQIGFRSFRRTLITCALTGIIVYGAVILFNPFGTDRFAFINAFLLVLPGAIASVMICWVLLGTHVQAFVRSGGAFISLSVGIMATAVLYCLTTFAYFPGMLNQDALFSSACVGIIAALFFFAVRDVYATSLVTGLCSVFTMADRISPLYLHDIVPSVWISAALSVSCLTGIHLYLSRNFITIKIPAK